MIECFLLALFQFCTVNLVAGFHKLLVVRRFCNICDFFLDRTSQLNKFMGIYVEKILFVFSAKQYIVVFGVKK